MSSFSICVWGINEFYTLKLRKLMLRVICKNPSRKKKSPTTRTVKNWQVDGKITRPKWQE